MSFDPEGARRAIENRLRNSFGLSEPLAQCFARAAIDEFLRTHGGDQHYIPKRAIERDVIRRERRNGVSVAAISRRHGISTRTVLRVLAATPVQKGRSKSEKNPLPADT